LIHGTLIRTDCTTNQSTPSASDGPFRWNELRE